MILKPHSDTPQETEELVLHDVLDYFCKRSGLEDRLNYRSTPLAPNLFERELEFTEEVTIDLDFFDMIA